jgi:hypothetical protein
MKKQNHNMNLGELQDYKKLLVKPVQRQSVQNRHQIVYNRFNPQKKQIDASIVTNKIKAKSAAETYFFTKNETKTRIQAGLEQMVVNPFKGFSPLKLRQDYSLTTNWDNLLIEIVKQDYISLQTKFEILDGVEPDYYTQKVTPKKTRDGILPEAEAPLTFLESFKFTFYDRTNVLTNETTRGRFAIQLVENHPAFADKKESINNNAHRFYIAEVNEDEVDYLNKEDVINDCIADWVDIQRQSTPSLLIDFATLLLNDNGVSIIAGETNEMIVKKKVNEYIKTKDKRWGNNIDNFKYVTKLLREEPQRFMVEVAVRKAMNKGAIRIQNGFCMWLTKRDTEHYKYTSKDTLVQFLLKEYTTYKPKGNNEGNMYAEILKDIDS